MAEIYAAGRIKRVRSTRAQVEDRRDALYEIVEAMRPMTVRQVFYQASVREVVEKTESGYEKIQRTLVQMRRDGSLPYGWIVDHTRWQRKPRTFDSVQEALEETARLYRKALWANINAYAEIWLEKDALSGVIYPVTSRYDVPLMVARGYASLSFLAEAAQYINNLTVPTYIYHLGDRDPSGVNAGDKIEETLRELAPDAEIHFKRLAVLPEQIRAWNLPTRPTKQSDARAKAFGDDASVELDAIEPNNLRALVESAVLDHLPQHEFDVLMAAEESERKHILNLVRGVVKEDSTAIERALFEDDDGEEDNCGLGDEELERLANFARANGWQDDGLEWTGASYLTEDRVWRPTLFAWWIENGIFDQDLVLTDKGRALALMDDDKGDE
jgi:hypothetical protein